MFGFKCLWFDTNLTNIKRYRVDESRRVCVMILYSSLVPDFVNTFVVKNMELTTKKKRKKKLVVMVWIILTYDSSSFKLGSMF